MQNHSLNLYLLKDLQFSFKLFKICETLLNVNLWSHFYLLLYIMAMIMIMIIKAVVVMMMICVGNALKKKNLLPENFHLLLLLSLIHPPGACRANGQDNQADQDDHPSIWSYFSYSCQNDQDISRSRRAR